MGTVALRTESDGRSDSAAPDQSRPDVRAPAIPAGRVHARRRVGPRAVSISNHRSAAALPFPV